MGDVLAVDHDPQVQVPLGDMEVVKENGDARRDRQPMLALRGELLQGQPAPVPDLDGVGAAPGGEQPEHAALAEGGVHAELQRQPAAKPGPQPGDHLAQERHTLLGIGTFPGRFFTRRMWPVWATWASSG